MAVLDVFDNDQLPPDVDYTTLRIAREPENGTVTVHIAPGNPEQSKLRYRSSPGYAGTDSFDYEVCNSDGICSFATVVITVAAGE